MRTAIIVAGAAMCSWALAQQATSKPAWPSATTQQAQAFLDDCAAKAADAQKAQSIAVKGTDGWLFFAGELRHLGVGQFWGDQAAKVSRASKPELADPTGAIVKFATELKAMGVDLLVVPVPPKAVVQGKALSDKFPLADGKPLRTDIFLQQFYAILAEKGVTVLDIAPDLLAASEQADKPAMYCKQDSHWSPAACELTAKLVARRLEDRPWRKDAARTEFKAARETIEISGDLWKELKDESVPREKVAARVVTAPDGEAVKPAEDSPVLLMGDSHTLVFHLGDDMLATGCGLLEQLAMELGMPIDLMGARGSAATVVRIDLYRKASANPEYIKNKKLVIWCFSAREFTESPGGWREVPVRKP
jgi:alginate O-acetyltransferase complex protein AlgJ